MKKWQKIILWSVIGLAVVIGILAILVFCAFTVNTISVEFETSTNVLSSDSVDSVIESSNIQKNKSLVLLDKKQISSNIEKANPYVEVVNIEIRFPRTVVVHIAEREALYSVQSGDKTYICDKALKVLSVVQGETQDYIKLINTPLTKDYVAGEFIEIDGGQLLSNFATSALANNRGNAEIKAYFASIEIALWTEPTTYTSFYSIKLENHYGFKYEIYIATSKLSQKLQALFAADDIDSFADDSGEVYNKSNYNRMYICENSGGEIFVRATTE